MDVPLFSFSDDMKKQNNILNVTFSPSDLFLSRDFHCQIAIIIVKTIYTYTDDVPVSGSSVIISQGMRQVCLIL